MHADETATAALAAAGRPRTGPTETFKSWGRSCLTSVPTAAGPVWIKHACRLPPSEEAVLGALSRRWPDRLPGVVATWPGSVTMEPRPGRELAETDPVTEDGPVFLDGADVVVSHPVFSCGRLLDQMPVEHQEAVIHAFLEPLGLTRDELGAMRRSTPARSAPLPRRPGLRGHGRSGARVAHGGGAVTAPRARRA